MKTSTKLVTLALILSTILALPFVFGCSSPGLEAEEIAQILDGLLPNARQVAIAIYGEGLPTEQVFTPEEIADMRGVNRYAVSREAVFPTREAMNNAVNAVFTTREAANLMSDAFVGVAARFYVDRHGVFKINVNHGAPLAILQSIDTSSVRDITGRSARVEFLVDAVHQDGTETSVSIALALENGRWLLDGPAF